MSYSTAKREWLRERRQLLNRITHLEKRIKAADEIMTIEFTSAYVLGPSHAYLGKLRIILRDEKGASDE